MKTRLARTLALPSLGLFTWALAGCGTPSAVPEPADPSTTVSAAPEPAPAPAVEAQAEPTPPVIVSTPAVEPAPVEAPPLTLGELDAPVTPHGDAAVRQTAQTVESAPEPADTPKAPTPAGTETETETEAVPSLAAPVVDAAKQQVDEAVGELGQGVKTVTDGVKDGVRQATSEVTQGVQQRVDGLKQQAREATENLGQKARDKTYKATSGFLKKLGDEARGTVDQGIKKAKTAVKDLPKPTPTPGR